MLPQPVEGEWTYQQAHYEETNMRIIADVEDTPENTEFFIQLKQRLKQRFQQLEIWIVSYEIRIV